MLRSSLLILCLALAGCAQPLYAPQPVETIPSHAPAASDGRVFVPPAPASTPATAPSAADALLRDAQQAHRAGRHDQAQQLLERALRIAPQDPRPYWQQAQAYAAQGDNANARQWAQRALSLSQGNPALRLDIERFLAR